ncbi:MAG TPA: threonine/serine dehydratase [Chloroflexota bacterium]
MQNDRSNHDMDREWAPELTVGLSQVEAAYENVRAYVHRTPTLTSATLSRLTGSTVFLKAENLQKTGSFKARGGTNAILALSREEKDRGVIVVSAGNHGAGVAYGARMAGVRATVVMPETAMQSKIAAVEGYGAQVRLVDPMRLMESMETIQRNEGQVFIHPFDNPFVIAGQGTVGLEVLEQIPDVEVVVVPVGGGGLISGIAAFIKRTRPSIAVVGVEPSGSNVVSQSLAAHRPLRLEHFHSIADGLNAPWSGPNSLRLIEDLVDHVVTVEDDAIGAAMSIVLERTKLLVEPAGAAAVAALLQRVVPGAEGRRVVAILSGGNVDLSRLETLGATKVTPPA